MVSSIAHASTWDKDINQFATFLTLDHHSNIYNHADSEVGSSVSQLAIINNSISLFEGYGVALPFSVVKYSYLADSNLNNTAFTISPSMQIFLSRDSTLEVTTSTSKNQIFGGNIGAEFADESSTPLDEKQHSFGASLRIGQAPQNEFFSVNVSYTDNTLTESQSSSTNNTKNIGSQYGYRISEDSYVQFSGNYAWQESNQQSTQLTEAGLGFITGVGGSNELNVIVGGYKILKRNQQGIFWTLSDRWNVSEQWSVNLKTSQRSTISNSAGGLSQISTIYYLDSTVKITDSHQLTFSLNRQNNQIKVIKDNTVNMNAALKWQWDISAGLIVNTTASFTENSRKKRLDSVNRTQHKFGVSVGYQW